jgi:lipoprotein-anchoring transpeptidase ErfK/SrfK
MAGRLWHAIVLVIVVLLSLPLVAFAAPQAAGGRYVVKGGDTLADIAWSLEVSAGALGRVNGITDFNSIYPGQVLTIPGQSAKDAASVRSAKQDYAESEQAGGGKWVDVDLAEQRLSAYAGDTLVFTTLVSTGTEEYPTPTGTFEILDRTPYENMSGPDYYLEDVPNVLLFLRPGYAIHGTYWHDNFGHPMSHGCINLTIPDSGWLYDWAPDGTPVVIHY